MNISNKRIVIWILFAILVVSGVVIVLSNKGDKSRNIEDFGDISLYNFDKVVTNDIAKAINRNLKDSVSEAIESSVQSSNAVIDVVSTEDKEELEEKQVSAFYDETDRWIDAKKSGSPSVEDAEHFHSSFRKLPKSRKNECLQRALNLIPDENVMLLIGILMDKTEDKKLVTQIYNDVLNRDEVVKKPILQTIFKDKEHPCWTDTAWILDVTGQLPKKN